MDVYCTHWLLLLEKWKFPFFSLQGRISEERISFFSFHSPVQLEWKAVDYYYYYSYHYHYYFTITETEPQSFICWEQGRKEGKGMSERASEIWRRRQATMSKNFRFGFHWELSAGWKSSYYHFTTGTLEYLPFFVFRLESCRRGLLALLHLGYILSRPSIRYRHHTTICANAMCVFMALQLRQKLVALAISWGKESRRDWRRLDEKTQRSNCWSQLAVFW